MIKQHLYNLVKQRIFKILSILAKATYPSLLMVDFLRSCLFATEYVSLMIQFQDEVSAEDSQ